jgi:predicted secreted protein
MNPINRDLIQQISRSTQTMKFLKFSLPVILLLLAVPGARAEMLDQGLNSIMEIIDKAIVELTEEKPAAAEGSQAAEEDEADEAAKRENANTTIVNLSRTLGTLSFSRLQCGEAGVLAEFTSRVQQVPAENRDAMRDAFQEGFDKSKQESPLLSQDECERLTESRKRREEASANVTPVKETEVAEEPAPEVVENAAEDPRFRHLRIAEMSGQLAFRRRICDGEKVFNRDYNEYLESIPEEYREEVKEAYWKGYQHGKRLNKNFDAEQCPRARG